MFRSTLSSGLSSALKATLLWAVACVPVLTFAQTAPPTTYAILNYYRAEPGAGPAYEAAVLDRTAKLIQEVMKSNPTYAYAIALRLEFGGESDENANYILVQGFNGPPVDLAESFNQASKKLFNKTWAEYQKELLPLRKPQGRTIIRLAHRVGDMTQQGDWLRIQYNRSAFPTDEYVNAIKEIQPLREAQVKAGTLRGISLWGAVSNTGSESQFSSLATSASKDLASLIGSTAAMNAENAKLAQPVNLTSYIMRLDKIREVLHSEIFRAYMVIRRPE